MSEFIDFYETLNVKRSSSSAAIIAAGEKLAKRRRPRAEDPEKFAERQAEIETACQWLSCLAYRQRFDELLDKYELAQSIAEDFKDHPITSGQFEAVQALLKLRALKRRTLAAVSASPVG